MAMSEKQKTDGAFLEIFGNPVDNGYSPDISFVGELLGPRRFQVRKLFWEKE